MTGKFDIPLKTNNKDYTEGKISFTLPVFDNYGIIKIDHIARVGDHFEAAYTIAPKCANSLFIEPKITCSMRESHG